MPDGHVKWYDPKREEGVVERNGREYAVRGGDIDNHAKTAGSPVHFDIQRTDAGDVATSVVLRPGSRTTRGSYRVGDLTGAHHPSDKGQDEEVDLGDLTVRRRAYGDQPRLLAEDWVRFIGSGQIDRAVDLYAPDATIREGEQQVAGGDDIRRWLAASPLHGAPAGGAEITGDGEDGFTVRWRTLPGEEAAVDSTLRITNGAIVEQTTAEAG